MMDMEAERSLQVFVPSALQKPGEVRQMGDDEILMVVVTVIGLLLTVFALREKR